MISSVDFQEKHKHFKIKIENGDFHEKTVEYRWNMKVKLLTRN